jgi:hypothetical protein
MCLIGSHLYFCLRLGNSVVPVAIFEALFVRGHVIGGRYGRA